MAARKTSSKKTEAGQQELPGNETEVPKPEAEALGEPKRMRVRALRESKKTLFWPVELVGTTKDVRGTAGYVVDWTLPHERDWCKGQEYKLERAPDDAEPSPIEGCRQAEKALARINGTVPPDPKTLEQQKEDNASAAAETSTVPPVAPPPTKKA